VRDAEGMSDDEKLSTLFGTGGASSVPWRFGMEYRPREQRHPSALLAWLLAVAAFFVFITAFAAVPLAVRAARGGNRLAWVAAVVAVVGAVASFTVMPRLWG
jgi:membrane protein YdbS with pleckstrin-like domain